MRRFLLGVVVAVGLACCIPAGEASAHTPQVVDSCTGLSVSLTQYEGSTSNNRVVVTIDGASQQFDFGGSFSRTFPWAPTSPHTWTVAIDANRIIGDPSQYDRTINGSEQPCQTATSTSIPTTTSTTSTTTTQAPPTSSTTTSTSVATSSSTSAPSTSTPTTVVVPTTDTSAPSTTTPSEPTAGPSTSSFPEAPESTSSTAASIGEPPVPPPSVEVQPAPNLDGTLPATGMRASGWGAFWVGAIASAAGVGLLLMARRGDLK